jgi:hypothetical protein
MMVIAVVADKALANEMYHVDQENASLTPIFTVPRQHARARLATAA